MSDCGESLFLPLLLLWLYCPFKKMKLQRSRYVCKMNHMLASYVAEFVTVHPLWICVSGCSLTNVWSIAFINPPCGFCTFSKVMVSTDGKTNSGRWQHVTTRSGGCSGTRPYEECDIDPELHGVPTSAISPISLDNINASMFFSIYDNCICNFE